MRERPPTRRDVLRRTIGLAGAALAARCGSDSPTAPTASTGAATAGSGTTAAVPDATFVRIPANASFTFAADPSNSAGRGESSPILAPYCLSVNLVTNAEYQAFLAAGGRGSTPRYWRGTYPDGKADHPVLWVSYTDVEAYCAWLTSRYPGWIVRPPTEAEWENAARGPSGTTYPWGNNADIAYSGGTLTSPFNYHGVCAAEYLRRFAATLATFNDPASTAFGTRARVDAILRISSTGSVTGWTDTTNRAGFTNTDLYDALVSEGGFTTPVGSYANGRSAYGCNDLAGNAFEWTSSLVRATNGVEAGQLVNAVRGGSWYANASSGRATYRGEGRSPSGGYHSVGVRVAAVPV